MHLLVLNNLFKPVKISQAVLWLETLARLAEHAARPAFHIAVDLSLLCPTRSVVGACRWLGAD